MQGPLDDEKELLRNRRTLYLLLGGAASLILPLLVALYIRYNEAAGLAPGTSTGLAFERRDGAKILPAATPAPMGGLTPAAPAGAPAQGSSPGKAGGDSSLSFVRGGDDYFHEKAAPAPAPPQAPKPAVQVAAAAPAPPPPAPVKKGPKPFAMPKLQPTKGFSNFRGGSQGAAAAAQPQGQGGPNAQALQAKVAAAEAASKEKHYGKSASGAGSGADLPRLGGGNFGWAQQRGGQQGGTQSQQGQQPPAPTTMPADAGTLLQNLQGQQQQR